MDKRRFQEEWKKRHLILRHPCTWIIVFLFFFNASFSYAQELFPTVEPASTMPKKMVAYRQINEMYRDINNRAKYFAGFRLMYGLTKNITIMTMVGASNHHFKKIPTNFANYILNHHKAQYLKYPFLIEGIHVYAKYRAVNFDKSQKHLRIATYAEASKSFVAHSEAESNLMTENTGYGGGLIFTLLNKRFATSVTWGFIKSLPYTQKDQYQELKFQPGAVNLYNVSFGYRVYPKKYDSYNDININLYAEFINKSYTAAKIYYNDIPYNYDYLKTIDGYPGTLYTYNGLIANHYSELRSSIQCIFNSSNRLDIGMAVPLYSRSYLHDYPLIFINFQKIISN